MNHTIKVVRQKAAGFWIGDEPVDAPPSQLDQLESGEATPRTVSVRVEALVILAGLIVAGLAAMLGMTLLGILPDAHAEPQQTCYEDQKCWDPATMGNLEGELPAGETPVAGDYEQADQ